MLYTRNESKIIFLTLYAPFISGWMSCLISFVCGRCKIKFWPPIEYRPGVTIQWIFRWIMTLPSCWILIAPLNFYTLLSRNSTGRRYVDGSEFHVELWPRVKIPRWILTLDQNFTLKCDLDLGSQFNVKLGPGVIIQRGIMTRGHNSTWNFDPGSVFNVESWPRVTIQRVIMTRGHNSTWNHDPRSQTNVEFWPGVTIQRGIMTHGHNSISIRSVTDVLRAHCGLTPYTFYKPTLGPQYVSNIPYKEFITPTTFI